MIARFLEPLPLIAILRGVTPEDVLPIGRALAESGFRIIEVSLNSPRPFESIRLLRQAFGDDCLVGAGTVTSTRQVEEVAAAGGRIIVMPHSDPLIIRTAKDAGLYCTPGICTPTEGFAALANGADALKLFPAEMATPPVLKAMRSVFPQDTLFLPVGGITPAKMGDFIEAGAAGFGLGSALYRPGADIAEVTHNARAFREAWQIARGRSASLSESPGRSEART